MKKIEVSKNNDLLILARNLRKNMTRHEKKLWYDFLQKYPVKFYKQRIIDSYIADFYCDSAKLVIELDGSQHRTEEGIEKDAIRTERIEQYGILVMRIPNRLIDRDFAFACCAIDDMVQKRLQTFEK